MTKVGRAYSLDISTVEELEEFTRIPGVYKPRNKSKYVNEALQFYMRTNIKERIEQNRTLKENLTRGLVNKDIIIGGVGGRCRGFAEADYFDYGETRVPMSMVSVEEAPTEIASRAIRIPTYRVQVASSTGSLAIGSSVIRDHSGIGFLPSARHRPKQ